MVNAQVALSVLLGTHSLGVVGYGILYDLGWRQLWSLPVRITYVTQVLLLFHFGYIVWASCVKGRPSQSIYLSLLSKKHRDHWWQAPLFHSLTTFTCFLLGSSAFKYWVNGDETYACLHHDGVGSPRQYALFDFHIHEQAFANWLLYLTYGAGLHEREACNAMLMHLKRGTITKEWQSLVGLLGLYLATGGMIAPWVYCTQYFWTLVGALLAFLLYVLPLTPMLWFLGSKK